MVTFCLPYMNCCYVPLLRRGYFGIAEYTHSSPEPSPSTENNKKFWIRYFYLKQLDYDLNDRKDILEFMLTVTFAACGRTFFSGQIISAFIVANHVAPKLGVFTSRWANPALNIKF